MCSGFVSQPIRSNGLLKVPQGGTSLESMRSHLSKDFDWPCALPHFPGKGRSRRTTRMTTMWLIRDFCLSAALQSLRCCLENHLLQRRVDSQSGALWLATDQREDWETSALGEADRCSCSRAVCRGESVLGELGSSIPNTSPLGDGACMMPGAPGSQTSQHDEEGGTKNLCWCSSATCCLLPVPIYWEKGPRNSKWSLGLRIRPSLWMLAYGINREWQGVCPHGTFHLHITVNWESVFWYSLLCFDKDHCIFYPEGVKRVQ